MKISKEMTLITTMLLVINIPGCISSQRNNANGKIVFQSNRNGNYDLYIMNSDGSKLQNLTNNSSNTTGPRNNTRPIPSPDGSQIAFESDRDGNSEIYVIKIIEGYQSNLTNNEANDYSPTWSPDGKHIAFLSDRDATLVVENREIWTNDIYIMDANGSNTRRITNNNNTNSFGNLAWSPDGKKLAFCLSSMTQYGGFFSMGINLLTLGDNNLTRLTFDQSTQQCSPQWSPDGKRLVYSVLGSGLANIYIMNSDGTDQVPLTKDIAVFDSNPYWSPDGKNIIFSSRRDNRYHLYIMSSDGSNQVQLTTGMNEETFPIWLPMP